MDLFVVLPVVTVIVWLTRQLLVLVLSLLMALHPKKRVRKGAERALRIVTRLWPWQRSPGP